MSISVSNTIYKVTDVELTSVADAIRAKAGISTSISYPGGFIDEINKISAKPYTLEDVMYKRIGTLSPTNPAIPLSSIPSYYFYNFSSLKFDDNVTFPNCSYIGSYAFNSCCSLTTANFPSCSDIGASAFHYCTSLSVASFPVCSYISGYAFYKCNSLTIVDFPACSYIGYSAFDECTSLSTVSFPVCSYIGNYAFLRCYSLMSVYLLSTSVVSLYDRSVFADTPMSPNNTGSFGSIYVPSSLVEQYKVAPNWSYYSSRIVGI